MSRYAVYLEIAQDRRCLAHVLDLPGCIVGASTRDDALRQLPAAIRDYQAWLRRHGEPAPPADEPIEVEVVTESTGSGPFDPGDTAALFPPDRERVAPEEMDWYFRLMAHSRADLLALVQDLPGELLDWQPQPGSFTIRRLLRHVGNAEEWYVSRLVPPESLPPEWQDDESLPLFEFLEMERRTAVARLQQLTEEERAGLFYPTAWTDHPEEAWTVRKALRRFLEHEREHMAQVQEILTVAGQEPGFGALAEQVAAWRGAEGQQGRTGPKAVLSAALAAARQELLAAAALVPVGERASRPVCGEWTLQDVIGHVADWEWLGVDGLRRMAAGQPPGVEHIADIEQWNRAHVVARRGQAWETVWADFDAAHQALLDILGGMRQDDLARTFPFPWGPEGTPYDWLCVYVAHDREHAQGLRGQEGEGLVGQKAPGVI